MKWSKKQVTFGIVLFFSIYQKSYYGSCSFCRHINVVCYIRLRVSDCIIHDPFFSFDNWKQMASNHKCLYNTILTGWVLVVVFLLFLKKNANGACIHIRTTKIALPQQPHDFTSKKYLIALKTDIQN